MYGYVYKTTNLINGKIYIGKRVASKHDLSYFGSGIRLKAAIDKYGLENFVNEIICECSSKEDLCQSEIYWINKLNSNDQQIGYNLTAGGEGGNTMMLKSNDEIEDIYKKIQTTKKANKALGIINKRKCKHKTKNDLTEAERAEHGLRVKNGLANRSDYKKSLEKKHKSDAMKLRMKTQEAIDMIKRHNENNKWGSKQCYCIVDDQIHRFSSRDDAAIWWMSNDDLINSYKWARMTNKRWVINMIKRSMNTGKIEYSTKGGNHEMYTITNIIWFDGDPNGR